MSEHKPAASEQDIRLMLADRFGADPDACQPIAHGDTSDAYFMPDNTVLRINATDQYGFLKDAAAAAHFGSAELPVPATLDIGRVMLADAEVNYSITERAAGTTVTEVPESERELATGSLLQLLSQLAATEPRGPGFEAWDPVTLCSTYASWPEAIAHMQEIGDDPALSQRDFYDLDIRRAAQAEINRLVPATPALRRLVHGDFKTDNVLIQDGHVTGLIDWYNSLYGDPLYDVAWLDFGTPELGAAKAFKRGLEHGDGLSNDYDDRLRCYQLLIGINGLAFFTLTNEREQYAAQHARTRMLLDV